MKNASTRMAAEASGTQRDCDRLQRRAEVARWRGTESPAAKPDHAWAQAGTSSGPVACGERSRPPAQVLLVRLEAGADVPAK
jgi:hypothetical protein